MKSLRWVGVVGLTAMTGLAVVGVDSMASAAGSGLGSAAPRATSTPATPVASPATVVPQATPTAAVRPIARPAPLLPTTKPAPTIAPQRPVTQPGAAATPRPSQAATTAPLSDSSPSEIRVTKVASPPKPPAGNDFRFEAHCLSGYGGSAGISSNVTLPVTTGSLVASYVETTCQVTETRTGGAASTSWSYVNPEGVVESGTGTTATVSVWHTKYPGFTYVVTFTNRYVVTQPSPSATPSATSAPTPTPTATPGATPSATTTPVAPPQGPVIEPTPTAAPDERVEQSVDVPVRLPGTVSPSGPTVIVPKPVSTNAGQSLRTTIFCIPLARGAAMGERAGQPRGDVRTCTVSVDESGRVTLDVAAAGKLRVVAVLWAPSTSDHLLYLKVKSWIVEP